MQVNRCLVAALALGLSGVAWSQSTTYTTTEDFNLGTLNGVVADPDDELRIDQSGSTFPLLWIAEAGADTIAKIDTDSDSIVARYATWFRPRNGSAFSGPAPSRSAVDSEGNVYIANRHFSENRPIHVLKILADGGVDRNSNGTIDTSAGPGDVRYHTDVNGDNLLTTDELNDERIAWAEPIPGTNNGFGRSLCIGLDGNLWVGSYNGFAYYKVDSSDGSVIAGPYAVSYRPYGCAVDSDGILWSASLSSILGVFDTNPGSEGQLAALNSGRGSYGIAIGNGKAYLGGTGSSYTVWDPNSGAGEPDGDPTTGSFSFPAVPGISGLGISVDQDGNVVTGNTRVLKFDGGTDVAIWDVPGANPSGNTSTRGVLPDSDGDVWLVNLSSNTVGKVDGSNGSPILTLPVGQQPYTYSDATGVGFNTVTNPQGIWTVVTDSGTPGQGWDSVSWNGEPEGNVPAGANLIIEARAGDALPITDGYDPVPGNGVGGLGLTGQYLEVRARLQKGDSELGPVLSDLTVNQLIEQLSCDVDDNGQVDINDIRAISARRNQTVPPADPIYDIDGNGVINVNDSRQCVLECTNSRCAP
ncbi:MAG: hypothetical protein QNJ19_17590 [Woeseiaceae bacterium]|nr:hypothetical protein [Woeseiaceae bacterium]